MPAGYLFSAALRIVAVGGATLSLVHAPTGSAGAGSAGAGSVTVSRGTCSGVRVSAGASIQTAIYNHPAEGTIFCLGAGTWHVSAPIHPKEHDSIVGVGLQTVLDGEYSTGYSFDPVASAFKVSDLVVEHFTVDGLDLDSYTKVSGVDVLENTTGVWMHGIGDVVENSLIHDNGNQHKVGVSDSYGVGSVDATDGQLLYNDIYDNNTGCNPTAQQGGGASASKFWHSAGFLLDGNYFHDNFGNAIWLDGNSSEFTIENETIEDNASHCLFKGARVFVGGAEGIRLEVSCKTTVSRNTLKDNGGGLSGGIDVVASWGNKIADNSVYASGGGFGIRVLGQPRTSPFGGSYSASSRCGTAKDNSNWNTVTGNKVTTDTTDQYNGVVGTLQPVTGTKWMGNTYVAPSCSLEAWKWWTGSSEANVSFRTWQRDYGQDMTGSCAAS